MSNVLFLMAECKAEGCSTTSEDMRFVKGYCLTHYRRIKRKGNLFSKRDSNEVIKRKTYYKLVLRNAKDNITGYAKIDIPDYDLVKTYRWHLNKEGYVYSSKMGMMHRFILNAEDLDYVDHVKTGILHRSDNRRKNIRICTQTQNLCNMEISKSNSSGHKGVSWDSINNKWVVRIKVEGKYKNLGRFSDLEKAAEVYRKAAKSYHKEFFNPATKRADNEHRI